ncbi:hypothetical protein MTR67_003527 [Solanum verrucosum]|uniref:Reverse transcriptase zinc-binding domain-containing protein n=1 Tax=Solanum verrucosum TaxID=315347 RepID=A0AAF0PSZ0_SOLVR|nr:hypothetical protein MTR67_003527 [Solanum verrucosum]
MNQRSVIDLKHGLDSMQWGITKLKNILEGLPEPQTIYNMCTQNPPHNYSQQLYDKYREAFEVYITTPKPMWLLLVIQRSETRGPLIPFSLYLGHGRTKQPISDSKSKVEEQMLILRVIFNIFEAFSGGRLTLVNSVLDALPSYMMSLFPIPAKVTKWLDAIRRNFLWQGSEDKRKYHLVKWEELLEALKHAFPVLHSLSQEQEAELWTRQGWNLFLRRGLNDWEMTTIARFYDTMQMATNLTGEEDRLVWKGERGGEFTVKSAYRELRSTEEQHAGWPWRMIWRTEIPYKVNYFTWLLAKQAVLTHENLNKRKPNLCSSCYLCEEQVETVNHLFLHCKWTDQLWQMFIQKRKIKWTKPGSIKEVLQCWNRDGNAGKNEKRWRIVPACIWWTIWKERNQRCFEGRQKNIQKIKTNCLGLYYFWCKQVVIEDAENVFNIIDWL